MSVFAWCSVRRVDPKSHKKLEPSGPGHIYYAISDGHKRQGYGFSPKSGINMTGNVVENEYKIYANPAYIRTLEISKEQYEKLKEFGEASKNPAKIRELTNGKFNSALYEPLTNSCVDYTFHALRYSGVYNHKGDGKINVLKNAETFNKIPGKTTFLYDKSKEAEKEAPLMYRVGEEKNLRNDTTIISTQNQNFIQQCETKLITLCNEKGIVADNPQDYKNIAAALAAKGIAHGMTQINKMAIDDSLTVHILSYEPQAKFTSVNANDVVTTPIHGSIEKIQYTEQLLAQQAQERQMTQQQNQGRSIT